MISKRASSWIAHGSSIRRAYESAQRLAQAIGEDLVFDYSIGNPAAPCPAEVSQSLRRIADLTEPGAHGYMNSAGYDFVCRKIATDCRRRFSVDYTENDIIMTTGAACAINMALLAVADPGDEVVVFRPFYPGYTEFARNWGLNLVEVGFEEGSLLPDLDELRRSITDRTHAVIVNTPCNPTGVVYPPEFASRLCGVLEEAQERLHQDIYLISDEPYRELVYDGLENPYWPHYYDNCFVAYSFSKSLSLAGDRIGYLALTPSMASHDEVRRSVCASLGSIGFVNAPATAQRVVADCLDAKVDLGFYDGNRRLLYQLLVDAGLNPIRPQGAFYIFVPIPDGDERRFLDLCARHHVFPVEGSAFSGPGYARFSFCIPREKIERSAPFLMELGREYTRKGGEA